MGIDNINREQKCSHHLNNTGVLTMISTGAAQLVFLLAMLLIVYMVVKS